MDESATLLYSMPHASSTPVEQKRLDDLHTAIMEYFGHRLSPAPLEAFSPSTILELGSGSGAWALTAALTFPNAHITAVDLEPFPSDSLPPNLTFQKVDLTESLPFGPASFDIIHLRLVLFHLPNAASILSRVFDLLKPGGWLLIEDAADYVTIGGKPAFGPGAEICMNAVTAFARRKNAETGIARDLVNVIESSGLFEEIHVKRVNIPHTLQLSSAPELSKLGRAWARTLQSLALSFASRYSELGFTEELAWNGVATLDSPAQHTENEICFTWSRRRVGY